MHQYTPELLGESIATMSAAELSRSILYKTTRGRAPLLINDFTEEASSSLIDQGILMKGGRSLIMFPVIGEEGNPIGIIELAHPDAGVFDEFYIDPEFEDLNLAKMQGVEGLMAVRITVKV